MSGICVDQCIHLSLRRLLDWDGDMGYEIGLLWSVTGLAAAVALSIATKKLNEGIVLKMMILLYKL